MLPTVLLMCLVALFWWLASTEHGLEISGYVLLVIIAMFFNFTTLPTGNKKFVDTLETYKKTLLGNEGWWAWIGLYWLGIRFIHRVHWFQIKKERENPSGAGPEDWIETGEVVWVDSLLDVIPRPFVLKQVELGDRTQVDILVTVLLRSVDGKKFVYELKADFLKIGAAIRTAVTDEVKKFPNLTAFIAADKSETSGFLKRLSLPTSPFNQRLRSYSDLELITIEIPQYNADKSMLEAANKEAIAKLLADAEIATANGYATSLNIKTIADVNRTKSLAGAMIEGTLEKLEIAGATPGEKILALQEIIKWGAVKDSHLTTLVEKGGGALPTIPIK